MPKNQSRICLQSLNQHNRCTAKMKDTGGFFYFIILVLNTMANNIILANKDDPQFFEALQANLQGVKNPNNIVIAGDWSLVLDPRLDCCNYRHMNNPTAQDKVTEIFEMTAELELVDAWHEINPEILCYTWRQ